MAYIMTYINFAIILLILLGIFIWGMRKIILTNKINKH